MKSYFKKSLFICALFFSFFLFTSCQTEEKPEIHTRVFYEYFDTVGTLYDYSGESYEEFDSFAREAESLFEKYHKIYDIYEEYEGINNLATLNKSAGRGAVKVEPEIIELIKYAKQMYELTDGEVNIAFGAVLSLWHEARESGNYIPSEDALLAASGHCDIDDIVIDEALGTVELLDEKMTLDVGAVAKGYAVEMAAKALSEKGYTSFVIDMGGNLRAVGTKPDGSPWRSAVKSPFKEGEYSGYFELANAALVSSGNYERFYTVGGVRYHHIIDKDTLFPKNTFASVSVLAPSSAMADSLSTALFNMELPEAKALVLELEGVSALFVLANGETVRVDAK